MKEVKLFCPVCREEMQTPEVRNALSRYVDIYICSNCGVREALEGFFWRRFAKAGLSKMLKT